MEEQSCNVAVRVTPRSTKSAVAMQPDGSLKVWVRAAPVDGQANEALIETVAKALKIRKSAISIVSGDTGRQKRLRIEGITIEEIQSRLASR
ncbi:MAG: DUF167 domain-containing protein [Armatimonadetes bacterium]|nr:DUF167 domain-containing protein [Armatimonadota bacterium]